MIILIGPSASGKTEIAKILQKEFGFTKFVTTTTRQIRVGEVNDVDYHFISLDEFKKKMANDEFIETVEYNSNFYGTYKKEIGDDKVLIVEPKGFMAFKALNNKNIVSFYIDAPLVVRKDRMIARLDKKEDIEKRIASDDAYFSAAKKETNFVINNDKDSDLLELTKNILALYKSYINI